MIVLEWAEGGDLKNLIRKVGASNRSFSERQVWKYCKEMAAGIGNICCEMSCVLYIYIYCMFCYGLL